MVSAPRSFGSAQQFNKIPVLGLVAESAATASPPAAPVNGQFWYDTTINRLMIRENGAWVLGSQSGAELTANKDASNGYAGLSGGKIAIGEIPTGQTGSTVPFGNDARFTDSRAPSGTATGDLTGSYPNPTIALLAVTAAKIANATITDTQVAAANKDGAAGTASLRTLGTGAAQAAAGNDSRLSDARAPLGSISGDLAGSTYPALNVANLAITAAKIANATITDTQVAAANKDGVVGTASMRTIGTGAQQAMAGSTRLDTIAAPTGSVGLNTQRITALAPSTVGTDAVNRNELDAARQGFAGAKDPVRVRMTTNVTIATPGATLDGITMVTNDRVLLVSQTTTTQNGIYVWNGAATPMTRALDADATGEIQDGTTVAIADGTAAGSIFIQTAVASGAPGTWTQTWVAFNTGGTTYTAGAGLVGATTFDVVGAASRILVNADNIDIDPGYVGQASITTVGTISTGTWAGTTIPVNKGGTGQTTAAAGLAALGGTTKFAADLAALSAGVELSILHTVNSLDVHAMFRRNSDGYDEVLSWRVIDTTHSGVTADIAYGAAALRCTIIG
jgi:hypothetical protein